MHLFLSSKFVYFTLSRKDIKQLKGMYSSPMISSFLLCKLLLLVQNECCLSKTYMQSCLDNSVCGQSSALRCIIVFVTAGIFTSLFYTCMHCFTIYFFKPHACFTGHAVMLLILPSVLKSVRQAINCSYKSSKICSVIKMWKWRNK